DAAFPGPDADHFLHRHHVNFAVADSAGACRARDRFDHLRGELVRDDGLEFHLGQKIDHVFGTVIKFGVGLLAADPFYFADREARHTDTRQRLFDLAELEWLDDCPDVLHLAPGMRSPDEPAHWGSLA